jgi:hypothetical protein
MKGLKKRETGESLSPVKVTIVRTNPPKPPRYSKKTMRISEMASVQLLSLDRLVELRLKRGLGRGEYWMSK